MHKDVYNKNGEEIINALKENSVEVFIDEKVSNDYPDLEIANDEHYSTEFLDLKIAIKIVENEDEAIKHVNKFSSGHTEGVLTESESMAENFKLN